MKRAYLLAIIVAGGVVLGSAETRAGDFPRGSYGSLPWFGYGYSGSLYGLGYVPVPPYYALHPPVYYSHPQPRPYGHSPFACPCHRHGEVPPPEPTVEVNPYVRTVPVEKPPKIREKTVRNARVIVNPYCQPDRQLKLADFPSL